MVRNVTVNSSYWGLVVRDSSDIFIDNSTIVDGITITGSTNVTVNNSIIRESDLYYGNLGIEDSNGLIIENNSFYTTYLDTKNASDLLISSNEFFEGKSQSNRILIENGNNITVHSNIMAPATGGIATYYTTNVKIINNTVNSSQGSTSIKISSSSETLLSGNNLSNSRTFAFDLQSNNNINLIGNNVKNTGTGVHITTSNNSKITGNVFNGVDSYALSIALCNDLFYSGNTIRNLSKALFFSNDSTHCSRDIEITDNHYWNLEGKFIQIAGEATLEQGLMYIHGNYLDGVLFNGIPSTTTISTETTSSSSSSKTTAVTPLPLLIAITGKAVHIRKRKKKETNLNSDRRSR